MFFKKKKLAKRVSVYISDKYQQIIIAPQYIIKAGIIYEQENCMTTGREITAIELGTEVILGMNLFSLKDAEKDANLRDRKLTDWPAFKHSKSKSVKAFEQEYIYISISSCNEYNQIIDIEGSPNKESELKIKSTISFYADKDKIGERILKVYTACLEGKI